MSENSGFSEYLDEVELELLAMDGRIRDLERRLDNLRLERQIIREQMADEILAIEKGRRDEKAD